MDRVERLSERHGLARTFRQQPGLIKVLWIAFATFLLRTAANLLFRAAPTIIIDENLYTSLAKGLLNGFSVSYRGQPIDYPYLLYPMALCPVYLLERLLGGDIYRWIQCFNALLTSLGVIPAYLFAKKLTGDERKGMTGAVIWALMPDGVLSGYLMSESLIWLLSAWVLVFAWDVFHSFAESGDPGRSGVLTGVFTFLLFLTKPGAAAVPAVFCAVLCVTAVREKRRSFRACLPLLTAAGLIVLWYGVYFLFLNKAGSGVLGLYEKQMDGWTLDNIPVMLEAMPMELFLAAFTLAGLFAVLPLCGFKEYAAEQKRFLIALLIGIAAVCIGTAVFVTPYMWNGGVGNIPLHLRYVSMYLPALFAFTLALPEQAHAKRRGVKGPSPYGYASNKLFYLLMILFIVLCVFPGVRTGMVVGDSSPADSVSLAAFHTTQRADGTVLGLLETICCVVFASYTIYFFYASGRSRSLISAGTVFLAAMMLFNNGCAYVHGNVDVSDTVSRDALEIKALVSESEEEPLGVSQLRYDSIYSYWLECRLDRAMQQVTSQQFFVDLYYNGGVYVPGVPMDQHPNKNSHITVDTDTFVLGMYVRQCMELSPDTDVTVTDNGHFALLKASRGSRIADTVLDGVSDQTMSETVPGSLFVFDPERLSCAQLEVTVTAYGDGQLEIGGQTVRITQEPRSYVVYVEPESRIEVNVIGSVTVTGYRTAAVE